MSSCWAAAKQVSTSPGLWPKRECERSSLSENMSEVPVPTSRRWSLALELFFPVSFSFSIDTNCIDINILYVE
jgi:hypothetical protein